MEKTTLFFNWVIINRQTEQVVFEHWGTVTIHNESIKDGLQELVVELSRNYNITDKESVVLRNITII